ncbi:MAG: hypothetical protein ACK5UO_15190 [Microcystis sp.]|uniref:hypothetical protein n=1 Tax=Microcystis sp. TaxID=1127 RepID=UPI003918C57E
MAKIEAMSFYIRVSPLITPVHCITQTEEPKKINGLTAGIAYQQFTNRRILIALVVAILAGAAKLFGFFPPINLLIKFLVKKR